MQWQSLSPSCGDASVSDKAHLLYYSQKYLTLANLSRAVAVNSTRQLYNAWKRIAFEDFLISTMVVAFLKFESVSSRLQFLSYFLHYMLTHLSVLTFKSSPHMEEYVLCIFLVLPFSLVSAVMFLAGVFETMHPRDLLLA